MFCTIARTLASALQETMTRLAAYRYETANGGFIWIERRIAVKSAQFRA